MYDLLSAMSSRGVRIRN